MRLIRLVVVVSSPVPSGDDEIKMNAEKHECSLLKVVSDVGSTPTASTISTEINRRVTVQVCPCFSGRIPVAFRIGNGSL